MLSFTAWCPAPLSLSASIGRRTVDGVFLFQEKAGNVQRSMRLIPMNKASTGNEVRALALHTECCEAHG